MRSAAAAPIGGSRHVGAHHVDEVTDLRRLRERRGVDLLEPRDVTEDRFELAEETGFLVIAQAEPGKHRDVIDVVRGKVSWSGYYPGRSLGEREPGQHGLLGRCESGR